LAIGKWLSLLFKQKKCKVERTSAAVVKKLQSIESSFNMDLLFWIFGHL
jgi:hypothetical protein